MLQFFRALPLKVLLLTPLIGALPAFAQPVSEGLVPSFKDYPVAAVMASLLVLIVVLMTLYGIRHFLFTMNRLIGV